MKRLILISILVLYQTISICQSLSITLIPDSLKQNAHAVLRYDSTYFSVLSVSSTKLHKRYAVTILHPLMKWKAEIAIHYFDFSNPKINSASVYDAQGNLLKKLKPKDISDLSATYGSTFASSERYLYADLRQNSYPYTIEVDYEITFTGSMFYPSWMPVDTYHLSAQSSVLVCEYPPDIPVRYLEKHLRSLSTPDNSGSVVWKIQNIPAAESEFMSVGLSSFMPQVFLAPSYFSMGGFDGKLTSWEEYGQWINQLKSGRDQLPPSEIATIQLLTKDLHSQEEKIQRIYEYMQSNSRYVSIQLGIGGWQPFEATFVSEKKYGDCKALSNYTQALLKAADIPSNYTLINAGYKSDLNLDFPSAHFNHAILCVPNKGDTIWLECTSQTNPVGYQGMFTGNRHALVINESGGKIVSTKRYTTEENLEKKQGFITLNTDGVSTIKLQIEFFGIQIESDDFHHIVYSGNEIKEKWLKDYLDLNSMVFSEFDADLEEHPLRNPIGKVSSTFNAKEMERISGNRLIVNPNAFSQFQPLKFPKTERKTDMLIQYGIIQEDSLQWLIPDIYHLETLPKNVSIESKYGYYNRSTQQTENGIMYSRKLILQEGTYPKEEYEDFSKFLKAVIRHDGESMIFINRT